MKSWLRVYVFLIRYRFCKDLTAPLTPPYPVDVDDVRKKATSSLTSAGVFFGLSVVLMSTFLSDTGKDLMDRVARGIGCCWAGLIVVTLASVVLPYLVIRQERSLTAASVDGKTQSQSTRLRTRRGAILAVLLVVSALFYIVAPWVWWNDSTLFRNAFPIAGFVLVISSVFFLLFSLEFYDSASSWRANKDAALHFHLASMAGVSYLFGISLALVGASLLLCLRGFWVGRVSVVLTLIAVTAMAEIQRNLWDLREEPKGPEGGERDVIPLEERDVLPL